MHTPPTMPSNSRPRSSRRYLTIVLTALIAVPVLAGAAAPAAIRAWLSPAPDEAVVLPDESAVDPISSDSTTVAAPPRTGVAAEALALSEVAVPPGEVANLATITDLPPAWGERSLPPPTLKPGDPTWVARWLEIPALGVNVAVAVAGSAAHEDFPPYGGAYILRSSSQPGRGTNSYLFAHAMPELFKPLWWASIGQQVIVTMADGQQLGYRITSVVRDIPCPDPTVYKPPGLPPVLANATECDVSWTFPTPTERLTLQTSQGFNRNYGEMVVIAEPDW